MTAATLTIPEAADLLGVSVNNPYTAAKTGDLAGVPVLRVGRRLLVPRKPLLEVLGEDEDPAAAGPSTVSSRIPGIPAPPVEVSDDHRHEPE